jgi:hypothetical protein
MFVGYLKPQLALRLGDRLSSIPINGFFSTSVGEPTIADDASDFSMVVKSNESVRLRRWMALPSVVAGRKMTSFVEVAAKPSTSSGSSDVARNRSSTAAMGSC